MKVSVVIPTLNEEHYLGKTLQSLLDQKTDMVFGKDWEIIVADGGSTDKTVEIAKKYKAKVVHESTHTIAAGRHAGVLKAEGDIILFTDADVHVPYDWLENMYETLKSGRYIAVVGKIAPLDGTMFDWILTESLNIVAIFLNLIGMNIAYGNNMGVLKNAYNKVGGFNIHLVTSEDVNLVSRLSKIGKVKYNPSCVVFVSMRRVRHWGVIRFFTFHFTNFFNEHFFHKSHDKYEPIR